MKIEEFIKYPDPSFVREETEVINDGWQISFDGKSYCNVNVPFCLESPLSGVGKTTFTRECVYKKTFELKSLDKNVVLHFGAVDYRAVLHVNGEYVGCHTGGFTPFCFDVTRFVNIGKNELSVTVFDSDLLDSPTGKQSHKEKSFGCFYTRTTGIWQDVWLEHVPANRIKNVFLTPEKDLETVDVKIVTYGVDPCKVEIFYDDLKVGEGECEVAYRSHLKIKLSKKRLWEIGNGRLYSVKFTYGDDVVWSYFGLRTAEYVGRDFLLNGKRTYQKLVLDQGYNPEGIMTSPSVEFMQADIDRSVALGFNGARLHQKVFEPKFLFLCDRAGYMVWGEFASWGVDYSDMHFVGEFLSQWQEAMTRDYNHPSIVTWCPLNEAWGDWEDARKKRDVRFVECVYEYTKKFDKSRPCVDVSGGHHSEKTDVYDFHCYENIETINAIVEKLEKEDKLEVNLLYCAGENLKYQGELPVNFSEFGGICFAKTVKSNVPTANENAVQSEEEWGYGKGENDGDAFVARYEELIKAIKKSKKISGFCYTQLYDLEQECNGFYFYDRTDKFTPAQKQRIKELNESIK